jgi:hypothetical protein
MYENRIFVNAEQNNLISYWGLHAQPQIEFEQVLGKIQMFFVDECYFEMIPSDHFPFSQLEHFPNIKFLLFDIDICDKLETFKPMIGMFVKNGGALIPKCGSFQLYLENEQWKVSPNTVKLNPFFISLSEETNTLESSLNLQNHFLNFHLFLIQKILNFGQGLSISYLK